MKLTHQTGIATLIQFIALSFLNIANGINSVATNCRKDGSDCVSNLLVSIIFFILITLWFGSIWLLGYFAQKSRNKRLAQLLICAEALIALVAAFNARHHIDALSLITSLIDLVLALWIITLAFRLMRSGGKRITGRRTRKPASHVRAG